MSKIKSNGKREAQTKTDQGKYSDMVFTNFFYPLHTKISIHILFMVIFTTFSMVLTQNLFDSQGLLKLVIGAFILMTFTFDLRVILYGEIRG